MTSPGRVDMHANTISPEATNDFAQVRTSDKIVEGNSLRNDDRQPVSHDEEEADDQDLRSIAITFLSLGGLALILLATIIWLVW